MGLDHFKILLIILNQTIRQMNGMTKINVLEIISGIPNIIANEESNKIVINRPIYKGNVLLSVFYLKQ